MNQAAMDSLQEMINSGANFAIIVPEGATPETRSYAGMIIEIACEPWLDRLWRTRKRKKIERINRITGADINATKVRMK